MEFFGVIPIASEAVDAIIAGRYPLGDPLNDGLPTAR